MKYNTYCLLTLSAVNAGVYHDENYDDTLASCLEFADQFDNTCSDLENPVEYNSVETAQFSFDLTKSRPEACPANGSVEGDICTWTRLLCVTCQDVDG